MIVAIHVCVCVFCQHDCSPIPNIRISSVLSPLLFLPSSLYLLFPFPDPHSVPNALLVFAGTNATLSDYFLLALQNGHISVVFNNFGGLQGFTTSGNSTEVYSDAEMHQLRLHFLERTLELVIDNHERIHITSKSTL